MTFSPPSKQRIAFLNQAAATYHKQLDGSPAAEYLKKRGLSQDSVQYFRLGYVASPLSGHERYAGLLAIPYINRQGVVAIRYRCIADHDCKTIDKHTKYIREPGDDAKLYNILALTLPVSRLAICEGEIDTITAWQAGIPAVVGTAGAQNWKPIFNRLIWGYNEVITLADGDTAGLKLADTIAEKNERATTRQMPHDLDVNQYYREHGQAALLEKAGF
ncbi:toprim domain-containing protein [Streptomyces sp. NPDC050485]|uniref:toprim domain-containing protein n=1 Tax=Streptomyces sp. NPDC050485 TaxID=3365617 RepID=UPI00379FEE04